MGVKIGDTVVLNNKPSIIGYGSAVGVMEAEGPLGKYFDYTAKNNKLNQKTAEKAESKLQQIALEKAIKRANLDYSDIELLCAGDLLNQCIGSIFSARSFGIPFFGLYGACSTMALALITASVNIEAMGVKTAAAVTSSHFCSAERQYRYPIVYGNQRPMSAQWTVTGAGAIILSSGVNAPYINSYTVGKICDKGINDQNNMGAAMAPSAAQTLCTYFEDTKTTPNDYDMIFTGDLGQVGTSLLYALLEKEGIHLAGKHSDCGKMMFSPKQDAHSGGSGCGCGASVLCSYILGKFAKGEYKNILFCATGALLSPTSVLQNETIPGITHLVNIKS